MRRAPGHTISALSYRDWFDELTALAANDTTHPLHSTLQRYVRSFPYVGDFYSPSAEHRVGCAVAVRALGGSPAPLSESAFAAHLKRIADAANELITL